MKEIALLPDDCMEKTFPTKSKKGPYNSMKREISLPPSFSFLRKILRKKKNASICFVGLDRAGKSTIVYRLRTGQFVDDFSRTLGLNIDDLSVGPLNLKTFDLGGQTTFRESIWKPYVELVNGICFVIDSMDKDRYSLALKELYRTLKMTKRRIPLLVLLNKVDLIKDELQREDIIRKDNFTRIPLEEELNQFIGGFLHCLDTNFITYHASNFLVLGTSAKTGEGLKEAFADFFAAELEKYLDVLESDLAEDATAKDALTRTIEPKIKDYIPFAHPRFVIVSLGEEAIISAKPLSSEIETENLAKMFLSENKDVLSSSAETTISGIFSNLQFLLKSAMGYFIIVFGDPNDPFLAIRDLTRDVLNFLIEKDFFRVSSSLYNQIEIELEQYLSERYSSIPPIL
jgi:small GTP-binding protein